MLKIKETIIKDKGSYFEFILEDTSSIFMSPDVRESQTQPDAKPISVTGVDENGKDCVYETVLAKINPLDNLNYIIGFEKVENIYIDPLSIPLKVIDSIDDDLYAIVQSTAKQLGFSATPIDDITNQSLCTIRNTLLSEINLMVKLKRQN